MSEAEKPSVEIPAGQAPSYQLELEDIAVGEGEEAVAGRQVEVHYVGVSWSSGEQFDASWDRGNTFKFKLGKGQVIAGWDQGVAGMRTGGRRRITIPPNLAYGKQRLLEIAAAGERFDTPFGTAEVSHTCANDGVVEGIRLVDGRAFSVQYHPEAAAGPHDAEYLFDQFVDLMSGGR